MMNRATGLSLSLMMYIGIGNLLWTPAAAPTVERAPQTVQALAATTAAAPSAATDASDLQDYAARQDASRNLEQFAGGDEVVFVGGGAVILCIIVLLILL
jgi:hypothetical protein